MYIQKHIETGEKFSKLAQYYKNIDFPILSANFQEAADAITELTKALEEASNRIKAVENIPVEERKDETV